MRTKTFITNLLRDEQGATAIEYGLILALIAIAMITALSGMASTTVDMWNSVETKVEDAHTTSRS